MYEERERLGRGPFIHANNVEHVQLHVVLAEKYNDIYIRVEYVDAKNNSSMESRGWDFRIGSIAPVPVGTFPLICSVHELKLDG